MALAENLTALTRVTAARCLTTLCAANGVDLDGTVLWDWFPSAENFSLVSLISSADDHNLNAALVRLSWYSLITELSKGPVLLLLDNGNFIIALERGRPGTKKIVISDPLYQDGEKSFLPRGELENAWTGTAVVITPRLSTLERLLNAIIFGSSICFIVVATLLIIGAVILATGTADRRVDRNSSKSSDWSRLMPQFQRSGLRGRDLAVTSAEPKAQNRAAEEEPRLPQGNRPDDNGSERVSLELLKPAHDSNTDVSGTGADASNEIRSKVTIAPHSVSTEAVLTKTATEARSVTFDRGYMYEELICLPFGDDKVPTSAVGASSAETNASSEFDTGDVISLVRRGDSLLASGDLTAARLFYERGAEARSAEAALRLGQTYDRNFLALAHINEARANNSSADYWYRRAGDLGSDDANAILRSSSIAN